MTARSERSPAAPPPRRPPPRGPPREGKQEGRRGRAPRGIRAPRPQPAARPGWHHAARALRPPAHAPLAARVGAAVPSPRPPHHGPQGKCAPGRAPTCGGNLRSPAHIPRGGGRGKGGVRLRAPSPPSSYYPVPAGFWANTNFSRSPPTPILSCSADSASRLPPELSLLGFLSPSLLPEWLRAGASSVRKRLALCSSGLPCGLALRPVRVPERWRSWQAAGGSSASRVLGYPRATQGPCVVVVLRSDRCS